MKNRIRHWFKIAISPIFLLILIVSICSWCATKLRYSYQAIVPVYTNIEGTKIRVNCKVDGTGYSILAQRLFPGSHLIIDLDEIKSSPSPTNPEYIMIDNLSLQNVISKHMEDLKILTVEDVPEIMVKEL